jgi:hypothetical protein
LNGCACKSVCSFAVQERELTNDTSLQGCIRAKHCSVLTQTIEKRTNGKCVSQSHQSTTAATAITGKMTTTMEYKKTNSLDSAACESPMVAFSLG